MLKGVLGDGADVRAGLKEEGGVLRVDERSERLGPCNFDPDYSKLVSAVSTGLTNAFKFIHGGQLLSGDFKELTNHVQSCFRSW